jgi:DNA-binding transcriptional ArsR family regulator
MAVQARRDVFQAIADPTRREIIGLIARQSLNLNAIADNFDVSRPAISQHIKILTECGLIIIRQQGRERYCEVQLEPLAEVADWIEPFRKNWEHRFDKLDNLLAKMQTNKKTKKDGTKKTS